MPSLNVIKVLGHLAFKERDKRIPHHWFEPIEEPQRGHFSKALTLEEKIAIPNMPIPFFTPQNLNKYHQEACNNMGTMFRDFHDKMVDAVKEAHDRWRMQAGFSTLIINGPVAMGTPGCLTGPPMESFIKTASSVSDMSGQMAAYRDAVAAAVSERFMSWQTAVTIPGLPLYPAFAASPGPVAPPMPNVPIPLIACISPRMVDILVPGIMGKTMELKLSKDIRDKDEDKKYKALFGCIENTLNIAFAIWLATQQVTNVQGTGPVPTFAPPVVPVGPVLGGFIIPAPGVHLSS